MQKWEYKAVVYTAGHDINQVISATGAEGWELVNFQLTEEMKAPTVAVTAIKQQGVRVDIIQKVWCIFKRPVLEGGVPEIVNPVQQ